MKPPKKPRADSILDSRLTEEQKEELRAMLMSSRSHAECIAWLWQSCGVEVKSGSMLTTFWQRHCAPIVNANRTLNAVKAENYVDAAKRTDWDTATTELVKQTTFEILSGQTIDPKTADVYVKNVLKIREQDDARERLREAARTKEEAGIDALTAEAEGNPEALAALQTYLAAIKKKKA
jgi:hypothetical protein